MIKKDIGKVFEQVLVLTLVLTNPVATRCTARSLAGAALQTMSKECPVRKEADRYCKAAMAAIKSVDDQLTGHIAYLYQVSGGSSQQQARRARLLTDTP